MAYCRVETAEGYTVMSNYHLRDMRLSLKARGLLSQILSLPEKWDMTISGLSSVMKCSTESNSCKYRSSVFNKLKKFSAQALSRQFPFLDIPYCDP